MESLVYLLESGTEDLRQLRHLHWNQSPIDGRFEDDPDQVNALNRLMATAAAQGITLHVSNMMRSLTSRGWIDGSFFFFILSLLMFIPVLFQMICKFIRKELSLGRPPGVHAFTTAFALACISKGRLGITLHTYI